MARAGLCSRRDAELLIAAGRVAINGAIIASPAVNVTARDRIAIDGKPLPQREHTRLFRYYKPVGLVSTNTDPQGRPTLFDALPDTLPRLISVGRLDIGTEGLLLLTNDGALARVLELPETGWLRRYRVRAHGRVRQADLDRLRGGVTIEGITYGPIEATLEREQGTNVWLGFAIREGKNREVRNVLAHLGLQVNRLIRVAFGPFELGDLADGAIAEVETATLREELGARIVQLAGCDFSAPASARPAEPREGARRDGRGPRDERRGDRGAARRGDDERRPFRKTRSRIAEHEKPPGRPRRGDAWRKEDAPLRRTYRGSRRDDLKITDEGAKRAGLLKDRKGRRILVERFGTKKTDAGPTEAPARPPRPSRAPRRPSRDRASGPRPSRPKSPESRGPRSPRKR
jgi:23S rRNA pseudouridine2605 synthase